MFEVRTGRACLKHARVFTSVAMDVLPPWASIALALLNGLV